MLLFSRGNRNIVGGPAQAWSEKRQKRSFVQKFRRWWIYCVYCFYVLLCIIMSYIVLLCFLLCYYVLVCSIICFIINVIIRIKKIIAIRKTIIMTFLFPLPPSFLHFLLSLSLSPPILLIPLLLLYPIIALYFQY